MTTLSSTAPSEPAQDDQESMGTADDLIPMREHMYQRWQRRPQPDQLASLLGEDQSLAATAFAAGYMACWGDYREIILASQPDPERGGRGV
jgi:hypothetical protein